MNYEEAVLKSGTMKEIEDVHKVIISCGNGNYYVSYESNFSGMSILTNNRNIEKTFVVEDDVYCEKIVPAGRTNKQHNHILSLNNKKRF